MNINVFAQFYEFWSLLFQDIEKSKRCGQTDGRVLKITKGNNSQGIGPLPLLFYYKCSSCGYKCVCRILWNSVIAFSRYWITKTSRTDGHMDSENSIRPQTPFCGGLKKSPSCIHLALYNIYPTASWWNLFVHFHRISDTTAKCFHRKLTTCSPAQRDLLYDYYIMLSGHCKQIMDRPKTPTLAETRGKNWTAKNRT